MDKTMTYQIGDPNHLGVHNDLVASVRTAAQRAGVTVTLPDEAHLGDTGHVADHNLLAAALAEIAAAGGGMTWARVSGGTVTTVTNPDGSVDEVHTFTANGTLTVEEPGYARVLLVGGGQGAYSGAYGSGGRVRSGLFALSSGAHPVVVGAGGAGGADLTNASRLGAMWSGVMGFIGQTLYATGAGGADTATKNDGVVSDITGTTVEYATGAGKAATPGSGTASGNGQPGIVIVRVQKSAPTVSGVAATGGTTTEYTGDGTNGVLGQKYRVHTFTADGNFVVSQGGEIDYFVIGGGGGAVAGTHSGDGGRVAEGRTTVAAGTIPVVVGAGGPSGTVALAGRSAFGGINPGAVGTGQGVGAGGGGAANISAGLVRHISGAAVEYGKGAAYPPAPNTGGGYNATTSGPGSAGIVIVRYEIA